jgi:hypothetical protein
VRAASGLAMAITLAACGGNGGWGQGSETPGVDAPVGGPLAFGPARALGVETATAANTVGPQVAASIGLDGTMRVAWSQVGLPLAAGGTRRTMDAGVRSYSAESATWGAASSAGTVASDDRSNDQILDLTTVRGGTVDNAAASWLWRRVPADATQTSRLTSVQVANGLLGALDLPAPAAGAQVEGLTAASNGTGTGTLAAAWTERTNGLGQVVVTVRRAGGGWDVRFGVQTDRGSDGRDPALAVDADGRVMVLWVEGPAGTSRIRSRLLSDGAWQLPTAPLPVAGDVAQPQAIALGGGRFVATWLQPMPGDAERSVRSATWTNGAWILDGNPLDSRQEPAGDLRLAAAPPGAAIAVWRQADQLWFKRFSTSTLVWAGTPTAIAGTLGNASANLRLAVSENGRAVAAWTRIDANGRSDVVYAVLDNGAAAFSAPASIRLGGLDASAPSIAAAGNNALIAWRQRIADQANPEVMARVAIGR